MSTTVVVAREFRGQRLFLTSSKPREFTWSANRSLAMQVSVAVALRIITECEDFARGTDAFAIDKDDCIVAGSNTTLTRKGAICAYKDCQRALPGPYGTPGVSMSRADGKTLICQECGVREAMDPSLLGSKFRGDPEFWVRS